MRRCGFQIDEYVVTTLRRASHQVIDSCKYRMLYAAAQEVWTGPVNSIFMVREPVRRASASPHD